MRRFKVVVSDYDYPDLAVERAVLEPIGAEVVGLQCRDGAGLADLAADADAILQQYARIPRATIERLERCRVICRYGIGVDIVDVQAAAERGILVTNVPDYCLDEVADHTIALALTLVRRIPAFAAATRAGQWHWSAGGGPVPRLRGLPLGLIGFGRIAQNMARKLAPFGCRLLAHDPHVSAGFMATFAVERLPLDELLRASRILCVMCPYTPQTHHLLDAARLALLPDGAILVNTTRGKIVDNRALHAALQSGQVALAALDDTEEEPAKQQHWSPADNPLFAHPNCLITPHVAYVSDQALIECRRIAAENAREVLLGRPPLNPVRP